MIRLLNTLVRGGTKFVRDVIIQFLLTIYHRCVIMRKGVNNNAYPN